MTFLADLFHRPLVWLVLHGGRRVLRRAHRLFGDWDDSSEAVWVAWRYRNIRCGCILEPDGKVTHGPPFIVGWEPANIWAEVKVSPNRDVRPLRFRLGR